MRLMVFTLISLVLIGCAKPTDPRNNPNPVYASVSAIINGVETSCEDCLVFETQDSVIRVSFGANPLEECAGEGAKTYYANSAIEFPTAIDTSTQWQGQSVEGSSVNPLCFPDTLVLEFYWNNNDSPTYYDLNYLGKSYKIKKIN